MYREDSIKVSLDTARIEQLKDWVWSLEGRPGLVFYEYIEQSTWFDDFDDDIRFAQIHSMSHGVDGLQYQFSDILFLQPIWSRDATEQAVGRVWLHELRIVRNL